MTEVKAIHHDIGKLLQWQAKVDERCRNRGEQLERMSDALYGNPNSNCGLIGKVQKLLTCKNQLSDSRNFWLFILRALIIAAIIALAGWLLMTYRNENNQPANVPSRHIPDVCGISDADNQMKKEIKYGFI